MIIIIIILKSIDTDNDIIRLDNNCKTNDNNNHNIKIDWYW